MKKNIFVILLSLLAVCAFAQTTETVTITKTNGEEIEFVTTLRYYKGDYIFPDDSKSYIKGKINNEKTKLPKAEVSKIVLQDDSEYIVYHHEHKGKSDYFIGYYVIDGKLKIFKTYAYGHMTFDNSITGGVGTTSTINKVASVAYYRDVGYLVEFDRKKDMKALAARCSSLYDYIIENGRPRKDQQIEYALYHYNEHCE